jgi:hypothetical protein
MKITRTVDEYGNICYRNESGQYHREDGPAYESTHGFKAWIVNGMYHREDGPALIWSDGIVRYYLNNKLITEQEFNNHLLIKRLQRILEL